MSKLLVVFGATGQQGSSIVKAVLNDVELSKRYKLRSLTRDPSSSSAAFLHQAGIEVMKCDLNDAASIQKAVTGAHTVFGMTSTEYGPGGGEKEVAEGKLLVDQSVAAGAQYLIWSSSTHVSRVTKNALPNCHIFEAKAMVEDYIRTLPIKSAFYVPASFYQNYHTQSKPRPQDDGSYAISNILNPNTKVPHIDIAADTGKFIGAVLADPDKFEGKIICAGYKTYTLPEIAERVAKATGKKVVYKQFPDETYKSFLPESVRQPIYEMFAFMRDHGYYGNMETQDADVEWARANARGKVRSYEEYLQENPMLLD